MKIRYDILYLRFIAIISIVLYHFNGNLFKGGFIGVDILIVLTGCLNILSISNKKDNNDFNYVNYIIKKSNRLLPSAILVLFLCRSYIADKLEIISSLLFFLNYRYYVKDVDYFYKFDSPSPILHYWCLSLEYQFYFIIPLILNNSSKGYIICLLISISLSIFFKNRINDISYIYYCFIPRVYQFVSPFFIKSSSHQTQNYIFIVLYSLIHYCIVFLCRYEYTNMHIIYTLVLYVIINYNSINWNYFYILIYFSNISYSVYLVHYPIIVLCKNEIIVKILYITISSILLYILCERNISILLNRFNNYCILVFYLLFSFICLTNYTKENRIASKVKYNPMSLWKVFLKYIRPCSLNINRNDVNKVILLGDSHVQQWVVALYEYFSQMSVLLKFVYLDGVKLIPLYKMDDIIDRIKNIKNIEAIIMCNIRYNVEFRNDKDYIANYDRYYLTLQKRLLNYSNNIIIINDNPHLSSSPFNCLNKRNSEECFCLLNKNCTICDLPVYNSSNIKICDMNKYLCKGNKCNYVIDGKIVYVDAHHLTPYITSYLSNKLLQCINYRSRKKEVNKFNFFSSYNTKNCKFLVNTFQEYSTFNRKICYICGLTKKQ